MADYIKPVRRIQNQEDLDIWIHSECFENVLKFVHDLQESITGLTNGAEIEVSPPVHELLNVLDSVYEIIKSHPVVKEKAVSRFGKVEFRDFYDEIVERSNELLSQLLTNESAKSSIELSEYFANCWGDRKRIDYGSGHEFNFIALLFCLKKTGVVSESDYPALILKVFNKYMELMRILQREYWLEPAGSHGVWGLDDYHFLPFLFGASQLSTHSHLKPKSIHNEELVDMFYKDYMYFECIHFINSVKTAPKNQQGKLSIRWHSPMLDDISSAKSWQKIKEGMIKMYKAEVLSKLPICQHFLFGSLIECPPGISEVSSNVDECGHFHDVVNTWGDCCGIRIPSAVGAYEIAKNQAHVGIPFD